jgi:hypothetical protein
MFLVLLNDAIVYKPTDDFSACAAVLAVNTTPDEFLHFASRTTYFLKVK